MCSLNPDFDYMDQDSQVIYGGDELMQIGITVPIIKEDFYVFSFRFTKVDEKNGNKADCE